MARPSRLRRSDSDAGADARSVRLDEILAAATRVFCAKSYRRAQMADVAAEMGVSPGTLYNYVDGKEALFHLLIERGFGREAAAPPPSFPVPAPSPGATLELLERRLQDEFTLPKLEAALSRRRPADPRAELAGIVRELYGAIAGKRKGIVLLERSALDWPEVAALFYLGVRRGLLGRLERLLVRRMDQGLLRRVPDAAAAARFVNESIAWFAMHRHGDRDSRDLSDAAAEATVVDLLVAAFAKE